MVKKIFRFEAIPHSNLNGRERQRTGFEETYLRNLAAAWEYALSLCSTPKLVLQTFLFVYKNSFRVCIGFVLSQRWCESADSLELDCSEPPGDCLD